MVTGNFPSHLISLVLSWVAGGFLLFCIAGALIEMIQTLCQKNTGGTVTGGQRILFAWILLCAVAFSPLRYLLLQLLLAETFSVQSFSAFFAAVFLGIPIGLAMGIPYLLGMVLPFYAVILFPEWERVSANSRLLLTALLAPAVFFVGRLLFFCLLPYVAYSCHWLNGQDIMRATNGPAEYFYKFAIDWDIPLLSYSLAGQQGHTAKQRLRSHLAAVYMGKDERQRLTVCGPNGLLRSFHATTDIRGGTVAPNAIEQAKPGTSPACSSRQFCKLVAHNARAT